MCVKHHQHRGQFLMLIYRLRNTLFWKKDLLLKIGALQFQIIKIVSVANVLFLDELCAPSFPAGLS